MSDSPDDRWLASLSGRGQAQTRAERQAASLGRMFQQRSAAELEAPADPQRQKRLLNRIESDPRLRSTSASGQAHTAGLFGVLKSVAQWLLPPGGSPTRLSVAAAALAVVVAMPLFLNPADQDDTSQMRSLPGLPPLPSATDATAQRVVVADPMAAARRVADTLAAQGVSAQLVSVAPDVVEVVAVVPPPQQAAAATALAREGIDLATSQMRVRFQRSP